MKKITLLLCAGLAVTLSLVAAEKPEPSSNQEAIQVNYVRVTDLFQVLKEAIPEGASAFLSLELKTNMIVLDTSDPNYEAVRKAIEKIDQRPRQFIHAAKLIEIFRDGERVLSRSTVHTLEGRPSVFHFDLGERKLKLTLTSEEVKPQPVATAPKSAR